MYKTVRHKYAPPSPDLPGIFRAGGLAAGDGTASPSLYPARCNWTAQMGFLQRFTGWMQKRAPGGNGRRTLGMAAATAA